MTAVNRVMVATLALAAAAVACGGSKEAASGGGAPGAGTAAEQTGTVQITDAARAEAKQLFATRCAVCHGPEGRGDGPGGIALDPKPRNYHNPAWQDSVTDKEIESAILYGGAAVGRSPAMIANPDLGSKPEVVAALREIVRNFGKEK
jgi:mono/diheme cytochrome c family protein